MINLDKRNLQPGSAIWIFDVWSHPFFWMCILLISSQQVSLPVEEGEELVAEFLDIESKVTFEPMLFYVHVA